MATIQERIQKYKTAPFDVRFPNTNQTRNCYQNYLDFYRCQKALSATGKDVALCNWSHKVYKSICPMSWINRWDEQREAWTFAGKI